ncbi:MAG: hypothetical protein EXR76_17145 [Myxococcales bacterium]|nr:hypothetical protein [Myxococcales bacterium]
MAASSIFVVLRRAWGRGAVLACLALSPACTEAEIGGVGGACQVHADCKSGICATELCLSKAGDDDLDGASNGDEHAVGSDPKNPDTDGDGRMDGEELGAEPAQPPDEDSDGIPDFRESLVGDRDGDGSADQQDPRDDFPEIDQGLVCATSSECGDGVCVGRTCHGGREDTDGDGLSNADERRLGTNALSRDTDADGARDDAELGPDSEAPADTDADGLIDALESNHLDSDGDGTDDAHDPI